MNRGFVYGGNMKNTIEDFNSLPTNLRYLLLEARKKNYRVSAIVMSDSSKSDTNIYQITNNKKIMSITNDNHYPDLYFNTKFLTKHKFFTYKILKGQGIVMPLTFFFDSIEKAEYLWTKKLDRKIIVLKPENKGSGIDVYVQLKNLYDIKKAAKIILKNHGYGLIQEYIKGKDLRLQAVDGKLFAGCTRVPANVVGDGINSVLKLVKSKNIIKASFNPDNVIKINEETKDLLRKQNLSLKSVPKKDLYVRLKRAANIGLGGDPIDVTDKLHKSFYNLIAKLSKVFSVKTFASDYMVEDVTKPVSKKNAYLLEINAPCLWAHHHFAEGQKRNVAAAILDAYFYPEMFNPKHEKYLI